MKVVAEGPPSPREAACVVVIQVEGRCRGVVADATTVCYIVVGGGDELNRRFGSRSRSNILLIPNTVVWIGFDYCRKEEKRATGWRGHCLLVLRRLP
jgi:hypothetical protein